MSDAPSPPPPPDYAAAATAQGAANLDAARASAKLSNPNIISPYGNQTVAYGLNGDPDIPTVTQTLTPDAQATLQAQQQVQRNLAGLGLQGISTAQNVMGSPFSFGGPQTRTGLDTSNIARMPVDAGTTSFDAIMSRLEPLQNRQRVSQETSLINQGLRPGDEAWDNGMRDFTQGQNDLRIQAAAQALGADMSANQQGFNQALQSGQFENTAQQQALAQAIQSRQMPLNEITALMSGSQIQNPQFTPYSGQTVQPAPIMQGAMAQGGALQNLYNAQVGQANSNNQATTGIVGGLAMAAAVF